MWKLPVINIILQSSRRRSFFQEEVEEVFFNIINNAEKRGKRQVLLRPCSKVVIRFLTVMMKHGYIGEFEIVDDHRGGKIIVNLTGRINKVGVISPRFDIGVRDYEKWANNLLPSRQFG